MNNSLGKLFTITSFGESHGWCVGVTIDGCPAGLPLSEAEIQSEVDKRRPGAVGTTRRAEADKVEFLSGVFNGRTTGAPLSLVVWNKDVDSTEYERIRFLPRPGHADYTAFAKYGGFNDFRGGGRFSGRITVTFVMAGAVAKKLLDKVGIGVLAHTVEIGGVKAKPSSPFEKGGLRGIFSLEKRKTTKPSSSTNRVNEMRQRVEANPLRCADTRAAAEMTKVIARARIEGDSLGGIIEGLALNVPAGLGEPVFDTLEGDLAKALFAIPAVKGVEFGSGFSAAGKKGSENNDPFAIKNGKIITLTNHAGGILGGISNGMPVVVRVAIKPTPSIAQSQPTVNLKTMKEEDLATRGRHDTCLVPRAVPVVESMMAVTLCDFALRAGLIPRVIK